jgi:hypothetical protein
MRYAHALLGIALIGFLITFCAEPVLAQNRVFLDLSLDFLGEYQLPLINFLDTPIGGLSAITYDRQRDRFYALSDDRSQLAPARFYTLKLTRNPTNSEKIGIQKIDVESVTFLTDKDGQTYPKGAIDPEGIALTPQQTVFISSSGSASDRVAPSVQEFDLKTGQLRTSLPIPERYLPNAGDEKQQPRGVKDTNGFASLTLNPTGSSRATGEPINLFTATESDLAQDLDPLGSEKESKSRLLHYLIGYGPSVLISEYLYQLDPTPSGANSNGLVELLAIDQGGHFLSLERSRGSTGFNARIFQMTAAGATDTERIASLKGVLNGIRPVKKKLLLDLNELGIPLDNLEGMTLGPRLSDGTQSLLLVSDDNFAQEQVTQFLWFRLNMSRPRVSVTRGAP